MSTPKFKVGDKIFWLIGSSVVDATVTLVITRKLRKPKYIVAAPFDKYVVLEKDIKA